jgi:hypothetical protein
MCPHGLFPNIKNQLVCASCIMHRCVIYPVEPLPILRISHSGSLPRRPPTHPSHFPLQFFTPSTPSPVLPIFHFGSLPRRPPPSPVLLIFHSGSLPRRPPRRSFPFSTLVFYPIRSQGKLLSSCPLTSARPESGEVTFFLYFNYCCDSCCSK